MNKMFSVRANRKIGSIMAVSLIIMSIAAIGSLLMARTTLDQQKLNERRRELSRALYIAESGVEIVRHWGNEPSAFSADVSMFHINEGAGLGEINSLGFLTVREPNLQDQYPNLHSALSTSEMVISKTALEQMGYSQIKDDSGRVIGTIEEVRIKVPEAGDPAIPFALKVLSRGRAISGIERTVLAYLRLRPDLEVQIGAGMISMATGGMQGNAAVHWGEAWMRSDVTSLPSWNNLSHLREGSTGYDPYARYRTLGDFQVPGAFSTNDFTDNINQTNRNSTPLYNGPGALPNQPGFFPSLTTVPVIPGPGTSGPENTADGSMTNAFFANVPLGVLGFPDLIHMDRASNSGAGDYRVYELFKDFAKANGTYYSWDSLGNLVDGAGTIIPDFSDHFEKADRENAPFDAVFIDTLDGNPPYQNGVDNIGEVRISGNSDGYKGFFYLCADVVVSGNGNPTSVLTAEDPDGVSAPISKVFLDGVMFTPGKLDVTGNPVTFGAVIAEEGIRGTGTMDVYYDSELKDGLPFEEGHMGSRMQLLRQDNFVTGWN